jgi:hypothetical protein
MILNVMNRSLLCNTLLVARLLNMRHTLDTYTDLTTILLFKVPKSQDAMSRCGVRLAIAVQLSIHSPNAGLDFFTYTSLIVGEVISRLFLSGTFVFLPIAIVVI